MSVKATSDNTVATEEHYEFAPIENTGKVNIKTLSSDRGTVLDHIHTVTIRDGRAVSCTCKGHKYDVTRKHREAVETLQAVIDVADPDRCSNNEEFCPGPAAIEIASGPEVDGDFACFECWMAAFRLNHSNTESEELAAER